VFLLLLTSLLLLAPADVAAHDVPIASAFARDSAFAHVIAVIDPDTVIKINSRCNHNLYKLSCLGTNFFH
jgi:hypothetical protein